MLDRRSPTMAGRTLRGPEQSRSGMREQIRRSRMRMCSRVRASSLFRTRSEGEGGEDEAGGDHNLEDVDGLVDVSQSGFTSALLDLGISCFIFRCRLRSRTLDRGSHVCLAGQSRSPRRPAVTSSSLPAPALTAFQSVQKSKMTSSSACAAARRIW